MSATKTSRRSVHFSQTVTGSAAKGGTADETADSGIAASPMSPTRWSRVQEKEQLMHLNDRLSTYIDRVRQLESENQRLTYQVRTTEETVVKERNNIKSAYESELSDARRLLDETAKEKAKLQIEAGKYKAQYDELNARIKKLESDLKSSEDRRLYNESQVQDLTGRLNTADLQRKHWEDDAKNLRKENAELRKQLESARKQLEEETLLRVDIENRMQSLREELQFNKQIYEQELDETRRKRQTEITEINTQLEGEYQSKLQDGLREMRQQFSNQMEMNRKEIEDYYERKIQAANEGRDRATAERSDDHDRLKRLSIQVESLEKERAKHETLANELQKKIRDLESDLQQERDMRYHSIVQKENEIRELRNEIQQMMQDYQDLMDTKIQLDVEIEAYRRLLESEETRLRLTPSPAPATPPRVTAQRGVKRKRLLQERETESESSWKTTAETKGDVEIIEHDTDGQFVKLHNKGKDDVVIGGWHLKRQADDGSVVDYKFHRQSTVKPGKTVTVWSASSEVTHSPPADYVMKKQWPSGKKIRTWLTSADGEDEYAFRESVQSGQSRRYSFRTGPAEELGIPVDGADTDQRCSIM